mmetsp:Transcript_64315/g.172172  ORF Transcript_64315/g.172172 Transcript_64315/m.172172 type:complete len:279 (-) Transcript_64315:185-1021(-)
MPMRQPADPIVCIHHRGDGHAALPHGLGHRRRRHPGHPVGKAMHRELLPAPLLGVVNEDGGVGGHAGPQGVAGDYDLLDSEIGGCLLEHWGGLMQELASSLIHASVGLAPGSVRFRNLQVHNDVLRTQSTADGQDKGPTSAVHCNKIRRPDPRAGGLRMNESAIVPKMCLHSLQPHIHEVTRSGDGFLRVEVLVQHRRPIGCRRVTHVVPKGGQFVRGNLRPGGGERLHGQQHHPERRFPRQLLREVLEQNLQELHHRLHPQAIHILLSPRRRLRHLP